MLKCQMPNAKYQTPNAKMPNANAKMPNTKMSKCSNAKYQIPNAKCKNAQMPNAKRQTAKFNFVFVFFSTVSVESGFECRGLLEHQRRCRLEGLVFGSCHCRLPCTSNLFFGGSQFDFVLRVDFHFCICLSFIK